MTATSIEDGATVAGLATGVFASIASSISSSPRDELERTAGLICCTSIGGVDLTVDAGDHFSANDLGHGWNTDGWGVTIPFSRDAGARVPSLWGRGRASEGVVGADELISISSPIG